MAANTGNKPIKKKTEFNNDFRYDLKIGQSKENELAEILESKTIEVKYDLQACKTGNIYIEYFSRGKWSGISTTQATHWCYALNGECSGEMILIETEKLRKKVKSLFNQGKIIKGGDNNTSEGVLIPLDEFFNINSRWNQTEAEATVYETPTKAELKKRFDEIFN